MTSATANAVADTARRLFSDNAARSAADPESVWSTLDQNGFTLLGIDERLGGSGGDLDDVAALATMVGSYAVPIPLIEHNHACWLLGVLGAPLPDGLVGLGRESGSARGAHTGTVVPWGRSAQSFVVESRDPVRDRVRVSIVARRDVDIAEQQDLAGQPSDVVTVRHRDDPVVLDAPTTARWTARQAYLRAHAVLGAAERVSVMTSRYAGTREQFGVPIARFQAIQGSLAILGGQVRLLRAACDALSSPAADAATVRLSVLSARVVAGEVATVVSRLAHQIHGAIGYTSEYDLQRFTRRLLLWREADAPQGHWTRLLGRAVLAEGSAAMWHELVDPFDRTEAIG